MTTSVGAPTWLAAPTARAPGWIGLRASGTWSLVAVLSLVAAWSVLFTTPWGTGTGWDQAMYIGAARDLLAGKGLTVAWSMDAGRPLTHYPPLFPAMLALLGMSGADPWDVARYVNAVLRGVDLLVVSLLATWASGGSTRTAVGG